MTQHLTNIRNLIFDVDGTLLDSRQDIANAQLHVLQKLGITHITVEDIFPLIGMPLSEIFAQLLPPELHARIPKAKESYVTHYRAHMLDTTQLFPDARETLEHLHREQYRLAVATTKSSVTSGRVLEHFGIASLFSQIQGSDNTPYKPNPYVINKVVDGQSWNRSETIMIGDTAADVVGGKNAGVLTCGVTWGALTREQLERLNPDWIVDQFEEILEIAVRTQS
jgi:pyrophosphatase PpaX